MKSSAEKLPRGQSYPLKPSALSAALQEAGIDIEATLYRAPGNFFSASLSPPNPTFPYERLLVRAGAVPSECVADVRSRIDEQMIDPLVQWIAGIAALDESATIRRERQSIELKLL